MPSVVSPVVAPYVLQCRGSLICEEEKGVWREGEKLSEYIFEHQRNKRKKREETGAKEIPGSTGCGAKQGNMLKKRSFRPHPESNEEGIQIPPR